MAPSLGDTLLRPSLLVLIMVKFVVGDQKWSLWWETAVVFVIVEKGKESVWFGFSVVHVLSRTKSTRKRLSQSWFE